MEPRQEMYCDSIRASDGCELAFQTSLELARQQPAGPPNPQYQSLILPIHGFSGSSAYFSRNFPALAKDHWVVAPDLRGHGRSGRPQGGYHVARLAADLRELVVHLQAAAPGVRIVPVGCSIGAAVVWTYTELFGDGAFAGYAFVDQAPLQDRSPFGGWDAGRAHRGCFDEATLRAAQRAWAETPAAAHRGLVADCLGYRFQPSEADDAMTPAQRDADERFFTGESQRCDGVWLARLLEDHTRYDHREAVEALTKPTLVLAGRRTGCFPLDGLEETVRRVRQGNPGKSDLAEWVVFEGGHWMFWEESERFNEVLLGFVGRCLE